MKKLKKLQTSVMTSSSGRNLSDLFSEIHAISGIDVAFDLMVLRETDLRSIEGGGCRLLPRWQETEQDPLDPRTFSEILSIEENLRPIRKWVIQQCSASKVQIAALATYFPEITSLDQRNRRVAVSALINAVDLALELVDNEISSVAIVELVGGTILDPCACPDCSCSGRIYVSERSDKIDLLLESLVEVVEGVRSKRSQRRTQLEFALGVELEPGRIYVLNDTSGLELFFEKLQNYPILLPHVGLNLDIAHMRIAEVNPAVLEPHVGKIVHAHISDHPGMHTRDQVVGTWTSVDRRRNGYAEYLYLLQSRHQDYTSGSGLPFSGAVALELEGCNRIRWIHESLSAMKQLLAMAEACSY